MQKQTFHLINDSIRSRVIDAVKRAPEGYCVVISEPTRTLLQNSKLWPVLDDISKQVKWHEAKLTQEEWKDFLTACLIQQKIVPNLDGTGFIVLGTKTSGMSKKRFSELLELALHFGDSRGVNWSEPLPEDER